MASAISQKDLMREAFRFQEALVGYAYGQLRDWSLAEDAVQEAFLVLMEKWREYRPELGVYPWARRMVHFKIKEVRRAKGRAVPVEDPELVALITSATDRHLDEQAAEVHGERLRALEQCMQRLGQASRDLLVRYYWNAQSCEAISDVLHKSVNAIWISLSRIRKKLRTCVHHQLAEGAS